MTWVKSEAEVAPRLEGGCDHGTAGTVLLKVGDKRLVWRKGHTAWICRGQQGYYPTHLEVITQGEVVPDMLVEGGRLSAKFIEKHSEVIRQKLDIKGPLPFEKGSTFTFKKGTHSLGRPAPGHTPDVGRVAQGSTPQGGRMYGTVLRCSCGFRTKVSNQAPSKGGRSYANDAYKKHLEETGC